MNKINVDLILKNGLILTIDSNKTIIENGAIAIENSQITDIDTTLNIEKKYQSAQTIDANGKIVMPGLINTHTHLAMTVFRGLVDDVALFDWLYKYIFPAEQKFVTPEIVELGVKLALIESIHAGTTCFNNMYYFEDVTAQVAKNIGFRGIVSEGLIDFPVANSPTPQDGIRYTQMLLEKYANDELINVAVGVHSPYTCSEDLLLNAKELANKYNALYHIHLSETKSEFDSFIEKYKLTPTQYLDKLQVLDSKTVAAHCVWLSQADKLLLANKQVGIAHNPECNLKISSGIAPIPELVSLKAKVGLGTDGVASNNNLNLIEEMHTMAIIHKVATMNPTTLPATKAIEIATIDGAKVLNLDKQIGSLEIGKKADIITLDYQQPHTTPMYNPYSSIAYSMLGNEVCDSIINGKIVMKDKKILTIDEQEVIRQISELSKKIGKEFS